ncbi:MAG: hypothetical protein Q8S22_03975 [Eubacteriales bacterium]|nr:hypothetical protein [Eubacteriales bacterium]
MSAGASGHKKTPVNRCLKTNIVWREDFLERCLLERNNSEKKDQSAQMSNIKALIKKKISFRNQSRNVEIGSGMKKALIKKKNSFRQSF